MILFSLFCMSLRVSQHEELSCSVVCWYGSGYFYIFCQKVAGWRDCGWNECWRFVSVFGIGLSDVVLGEKLCESLLHQSQSSNFKWVYLISGLTAKSQIIRKVMSISPDNRPGMIMKLEAANVWYLCSKSVLTYWTLHTNICVLSVMH